MNGLKLNSCLLLQQEMVAAHTTNGEGDAVSEERRKVAIAGVPDFLATNTVTMVQLTPVQI